MVSSQTAHSCFVAMAHRQSRPRRSTARLGLLAIVARPRLLPRRMFGNTRRATVGPARAVRSPVRAAARPNITSPQAEAGGLSAGAAGTRPIAVRVDRAFAPGDVCASEIGRSAAAAAIWGSPRPLFIDWLLPSVLLPASSMPRPKSTAGKRAGHREASASHRTSSTLAGGERTLLHAAANPKQRSAATCGILRRGQDASHPTTPARRNGARLRRASARDWRAPAYSPWNR